MRSAGRRIAGTDAISGAVHSRGSSWTAGLLRLSEGLFHSLGGWMLVGKCGSVALLVRGGYEQDGDVGWIFTGSVSVRTVTGEGQQVPCDDCC